MTIIPFPNTPKQTNLSAQPNTLNLIDTAIIALEAIDRPSTEVAMVLAMLNAERLRTVGSSQ